MWAKEYDSCHNLAFTPSAMYVNVSLFSGSKNNELVT